MQEEINRRDNNGGNTVELAQDKTSIDSVIATNNNDNGNASTNNVCNFSFKI